MIRPEVFESDTHGEGATTVRENDPRTGRPQFRGTRLRILPTLSDPPRRVPHLEVHVLLRLRDTTEMSKRLDGRPVWNPSSLAQRGERMSTDVAALTIREAQGPISANRAGGMILIALVWLGGVISIFPLVWTFVSSFRPDVSFLNSPFLVDPRT